MFTRYNGIVFAISGVIIIFYYYFEKDIREGIKYVFWFTLISGTPMALWIAFRNFPLTGTFVGAREYVNIAVAKNIVYSYEQIVRWFIPLFVTNRLPLFPILLIVTAMLIAYAIKTKWDVKRQLTSPSIFPIIVISIVYLVFVVITTETRDRFFFYDDRYLIPLYGPALILIFLAIQNIRATEKNPEKHSYNRNLFLFLFAIWSIYPLWSEYKFIRDSIQDGIPHYNIYNLRSYQESSFIEKLQEFNFDPELQIFSNNTQAVYFSTGNSSVRSIHEPEQIFTNIPDIEYLLDNHNEWFNGDEAYLIWFLPNAKHNYFPPRQLINVYDLEPIIISDDGIVLLIRSKS
ncbi:MAG: hypothetical protein IH859_06110 [Chloroflexi bacterium]|nr:hypothetical protein [Chloroflexota bacterium]